MAVPDWRHSGSRRLTVEIARGPIRRFVLLPLLPLLALLGGAKAVWLEDCNTEVPGFELLRHLVLAAFFSAVYWRRI